MKKYKHKIIVYFDFVIRKTRKKRWSKNRYRRKCFELNIPIFIPDVEEYMQ